VFQSRKITLNKNNLKKKEEEDKEMSIALFSLSQI
jgi:hypothetical protein